jgi:hypothetical protein
MPRTATKTKPEIEMPVINPEADIHQMVMTLAATGNPDQLPGGAMTGDQSDARVRTYLEQGYKVQTAQVIQAGDVDGIYTLQIYYCLVKE